MKVLVTGSNGQLGHALRRARWRLAPIFTTRADLDICDEAAIEHGLASHKPRVVINAAAFAQVDEAEDAVDRAFAVNRDAAGELARGCARHGAALLHLSTDYVFGSGDAPFSEDAATSPMNPYAQSKAEGELAVTALLERHFIIRTAWLMSRQGRNFVSALLSIGPERRLSIVRDRRGNPTPADALAALLVSLSQRIADGEPLPPGRYHLVGKPAVSLLELARHIFDARAARGEAVPDFDIAEGSQRPGESARPSDSSLDTTFSEATLGIRLPSWRGLIP